MAAKRVWSAASVAGAAALWAGLAFASPQASGPTIVDASAAALGVPILVNANGLALYHYVPETKGGAIKCTGSCAILFPPLVVPAGRKPVAGTGVKAARLGTIKRPDGRTQVTYNGLTLYRGYYDKPGELNAQGQQGRWFAVTTAGVITKSRPTPVAPPEPAVSQPPPAPPNPDQTPVPSPPPKNLCVDDVYQC